MFGSSTTSSRVGSHARVKSFRSQTVCDLRVTANELHTRPKDRVPRHEQLSRDFASRPTNGFHNSFRDSQVSVAITGQGTRPLPTRNGHGFNGALLPCLPCICSVSCAQPFRLEPDSGLCNTHDKCACESSLSMSRLVYRLKASAVQVWHVDGAWLKHKKMKK